MAVFLATISCFNPFLVSLLLQLVLFLPNFHQTDAKIGVCNGQLGNNLPSNQEVVDLYKSNGIQIMRMYYPNQQALEALKGSNIELVLGIPNDDLQRLANDTAFASKWVHDNVMNYYPSVKFRTIAIGNEVNPNDGPLAQYVLSAMSNIYDAIAYAGLKDQIKVSTVTYAALISNSFPPSRGSFEGASRSFMEPIINFLRNTNNPLLVNIYPYFSYASNPQDLSLPYALFNSRGVVVQDGELSYRNVFDAMLDATYSAVEKAGGPNVEIVVSETGWPSAGGTAASVENAETYYKNLLNHVKGGTPKRPGRAIETYLYELFDENQKPGAESEKHFGLFLPNKQPKYVKRVFWCSGTIEKCVGTMDPIADSDDDSEDEEVVVLLSLLLYEYYNMYYNYCMVWDSLMDFVGCNVFIGVTIVIECSLYTVKSKGKRKKRDSFAANISNALSQFAENGKRRVDVLEKKLHGSLPGYSGVRGSASIGEMGLSPLAAGMAECQALLNTMKDLDEDLYYKILEKLHDDVLWRQIFMDMPEQRR
ncbi:hypothetical protein Vadar_005412 [Vaccinium darrowii]|uniref:Uncharacterized protein n=1 Tax=Vaccinium darrowii TaxID=229202 RepID=A0ACB7Z949_9ERIC|nr:hypothetical protein Vadar_005412 [Vaccinium darrowii]